TFSASFGSYETAEFALSHSGPHARGDYFFSAYGQRSEGNFLYLDNNGTPLNPADDFTTRRRNNAFTMAGGLAKTTVKLGDGRLARFSFEGMARAQGIPGIDALQSETASLDTRRVSAKADYEHAALAPDLNLAVSVFATWVRDAFADHRAEL